jgi:hypothetical protein
MRIEMDRKSATYFAAASLTLLSVLSMFFGAAVFTSTMPLFPLAVEIGEVCFFVWWIPIVVSIVILVKYAGWRKGIIHKVSSAFLFCLVAFFLFGFTIMLIGQTVPGKYLSNQVDKILCK